ncbi:MAG: hypothetical protein JNL79_17480 [Myxococcales bacterium]|nr:hypothetical protein [Myxococcales bacterium]
MGFSVRVRKGHRWVSIAFTVGVIVNLFVTGRPVYPAWAGVMALGPLVLLLVSGLYLFALPYLTRGR